MAPHHNFKRGPLVWVLAAAAVSGFVVVAVFSTVTLLQGDTINDNSDAVVRSCQVLNEAIKKSQASSGQSEVFKLFGTVVFDTPAKRRALEAAQEKDAAAPALPTIDCDRVAADAGYHPFAMRDSKPD